MASIRTKSTYKIEQTDEGITIDFQEQADYALIDINEHSVMVSLSFYDRPYDEMVTFKVVEKLDAKLSTSTFNKDADKLVHLNLVKSTKSIDYKVTPEHKFIEKRNHPKADPRGYCVKKPEKKNWDKVLADLDAESDGEQDANQALKKIYDGCDDDTKRAMEKSLYESQGTVLNMNWGEVGKGKVDVYDSKREEEKFKTRGFDRN